MHLQFESRPIRIEDIHAYFRAYVQKLAGIDDTRGIELIHLIRIIANLNEALENQTSCGCDLSGPRWALLMRLMGEEEQGNLEGVTPTRLSQVQCVSKNTISSLLRGLEEQGYVQRRLDPHDHRLFRIRITSKGRELIKTKAPQRIRDLNEIAADLSIEEREQLLVLLARLYHSISRKADAAEMESMLGG